MKNHRGILEDQLEDYSAQLKSLSSYISELNAMTAEHGTDREHVEVDLMEAEHNVQFYQAEIARLKKEIETSNPDKPADIAKPPAIARPGIISLALSPISFLAGALLGSRLKTRRESKDN